jgi:hypothetical protein
MHNVAQLAYSGAARLLAIADVGRDESEPDFAVIAVVTVQSQSLGTMHARCVYIAFQGWVTNCSSGQHTGVWVYSSPRDHARSAPADD